MEGGSDTTYYSQPYPTSVEVHILHFLGQKPTMLTTSSYTYIVKTTVAPVFKGTQAMKKKPAKTFVTAHHYHLRLIP